MEWLSKCSEEVGHVIAVIYSVLVCVLIAVSWIGQAASISAAEVVIAVVVEGVTELSSESESKPQPGAGSESELEPEAALRAFDSSGSDSGCLFEGLF